MQSQTIEAVLERDKDGTWYYVHVPKEVRDTYKELERRGAIAVTVTVGSSTWQASILPWADGSGQISVNKKVREKESLSLGQQISLEITPRACG
jgi:hypothetical protein